jgi:hypothetical protein
VSYIRRAKEAAMGMHSYQSRRAVRRAFRTRCTAVATREFTFLGERVLDLSPRGMLLACEAPAEVGDDVIVTFRAPGRDTLWMDAEAEVSRVIHGLREGDPGYCVALDFTYFEKSARNELLCRLAGTPPPIPQRRGPALSRKLDLTELSVLVRPIINILPRGYRLGVPAGVLGN